MPSSPASEGGGGERAVQAPERPGDGGGPSAEELTRRNAELDDRYKRALADLDNYRKRMAREIETRVRDAREASLREWLEAVDSVERALHLAPDDPSAPGLRAVLEQMEAILARQGVSRTGRPGEPFDPERHEAVGVHETDQVPDRTIVDVARSGFASGDRVVRPAQVIVARRPSAET
jgi:molecular chaperone GrpE